jgi:hypothetical protein
MKKITAILLAILTAAVLTACGKTDDADSGKTEGEGRKTEAKTEKNDKEEKTDRGSSGSDADYAEALGIELDTDYNIYGNYNWGTIVFTSDGKFVANMTDVDEAELDWTADEDNVYVTGADGEEYAIEIYDGGGLFAVDEIVAAVDGYENTVSYSGTYRYDGDHDWLDELEFYGTDEAYYYDYDEYGDEIASGTATYLAFDDMVIVTKDEYDSSIEPAILETTDGGATFEDDYYTYYPADGSGSSSGGGETDEIAAALAEMEESFGDRSSYADDAEYEGVSLYTNYYSDINDAYLYVGSNGLIYVYEPESGYVVPFAFELDDRMFTLYDVNGGYIGELEWNGYTFYEEASNAEFSAD